MVEHKIIQTESHHNCVPTVGIAMLKDELRPVARVDAGKTRLFVAGDLPSLIYSRMYLATFVHAIENCPGETDIAVGINVYSAHWRRAFNKLNRFRSSGGHADCKDVANWDIQMAVWFAPLVSDRVGGWLRACPTWLLHIHSIFLSIFLAIIICRTHVYSAYCMPSGCWLTSILNSIYNSVCHRVLFKILTPVHFHGLFDALVSLLVYGDDNARDMDPSVAFLYDGVHFAAAALRFLNWTVTNPDKSAAIQPFCRYDEIEFLKRRFRLSPDHEGPNVGCPIEPRTLKMMVYWVHTSKDYTTNHQTMLNCHTALKEWMFHGREQFNHHKNTLNQFLAKMNPDWIFKPSYDDLYALWISGCYDV